jgi:hypothetical protein
MKKLTVRNSFVGVCGFIVIASLPLWTIAASEPSKVIDAKVVTAKPTSVSEITPEMYYGISQKYNPPIPFEELEPYVDPCDCDFAGLQEAYAIVDNVYYDKKTASILADTTSDVLGKFTSCRDGDPV